LRSRGYSRQDIARRVKEPVRIIGAGAVDYDRYSSGLYLLADLVREIEGLR
jgi:hypothetical protein